MSFSIVAGAPGNWISVQQALRERWEQRDAAVVAEIARRKAAGIPLDDSPDWTIDTRDALRDGVCGSISGAEIFVKGDRDNVRAALTKALAVVDGGLAPFGPYPADDRLDGVEVRVRSVTRAEMLQLSSDLGAVEKPTSADALAHDLALVAVRRRFLDRVLVGVKAVLDVGVVVADDLDPGAEETARVVDLLDRAGFVLAIFEVARAYQSLSPLQRGGFGSPRPSTSLASSAATAPSPDVGSSGAAVDLPARSSGVSPSKPTDARSATSSTTTTSTSAASAPSAADSPSGEGWAKAGERWTFPP